MQINGETFARMKCKFEKRSGELLECGDKDEEFRKPVSAFLQALAEEAKCLEKYRLEKMPQGTAAGIWIRCGEWLRLCGNIWGFALGVRLFGKRSKKV